MKNLRSTQLICICAFILLLFPTATPALAPQAGNPTPDTAGVASLPAAALGVISATLGEADPTYHFLRTPPASESTNAWQTTNAGHGFDAYISAEGALIDSSDSRLNLRLSAYGCGDALQPAGKAVPQASANRIEYVRDEVIEWYVNGPLGLGHGFTVSKPCRLLGSPAASLLTLTMAFEGDLVPTVDEDEAGLTFTNSRGEVVLHYRGLTALDSDGKELPARLELLPSERFEDRTKEVAIRVETGGARYPITVDPWIQRAKLTASDGAAGHGFGSTAAISGDVVVVGAPQKDAEAGAAYVFVKPSVGWANISETAILTASDRAAEDDFGTSVAIYGDTIVVGARGDDSNKGSAYVYVKPAGGWMDMTETGKLSNSDGAANDNFGYSAAMSGDTIAIGAYGVNSETGAAYTYVKPAAGWGNMNMYTAELTASNGAASDHFGETVAISGDVVVVGAPLKDADTGAAYVFVQPSAGWHDMAETAVLTAPVVEGETFGASVSISNDVIVVSAVQADSLRGEAYVFLKPAGGWEDKTADARLIASDRIAGDFFGASVAISGDTIVVGAPGTEAYKGSVYVFIKPNSGWEDMTEKIKLTAMDRMELSLFGWTVAANGSVVVSGAWGEDGGKGSVYVFDNSSGKLFLPIIIR